MRWEKQKEIRPLHLLKKRSQTNFQNNHCSVQDKWEILPWAIKPGQKLHLKSQEGAWARSMS